MSSINVLSESTFDSIVGSKPALIDFGAEWCVYCKKIAPIIEEIASEHPELVVGSIDVDANPMLAARFRVHSLPTVLVMKNGEVVRQFLGAQSKETYLQAIAELLLFFALKNRDLRAAGYTGGEFTRKVLLDRDLLL